MRITLPRAGAVVATALLFSIAACRGGEKRAAGGEVVSSSADKGESVSLLNAPPGTFVYVSDERGNTVNVIDTRVDSIVRTIHAGQRPRGIRLTPDGKHLVVAVSGSPIGGPGVEESKLPPPDRSKDGIAIIDLATGAERRIPGGIDPENFDITPDGKYLYVSNEDAGTATALDMNDGKIVATVKVGGEPEGVKITPNGKQAWVTSEEQGTVTVIDVASNKPVTTIKVGARPRSIIFTSDGAKAYVPAENGGNVTVVDAKNYKPIKTISIKSPKARPMGSAISPDGKYVYISDGRGATVTVIDTKGDSVVTSIPDPERPWGIAISPDGKRIYTANGPSNDVSVIDAATNRVIKRIPAGDSPWGVAISK
jgi:YVTN family beta-propeller protein